MSYISKHGKLLNKILREARVLNMLIALTSSSGLILQSEVKQLSVCLCTPVVIHLRVTLSLQCCASCGHHPVKLLNFHSNCLQRHLQQHIYKSVSDLLVARSEKKQTYEKKNFKCSLYSVIVVVLQLEEIHKSEIMMGQIQPQNILSQECHLL